MKLKGELVSRKTGEAGAMTEWALGLLAEDRANGWNVNRDSDNGK